MAYWDKSDDDHMKAYLQAVVKDHFLDCYYFNMPVHRLLLIVTFLKKYQKLISIELDRLSGMEEIR